MNKALFFVIILFMLPGIASAAVLTIEPESGAFGPGDSFVATIKVEANSGCINTIEGRLKFPNSSLYAEEFVTGESLISIWVEKPATADLNAANARGELYFAGGIPGGYCGKIPGDPGESNIVAKIAFRVPGFSVGESTTGQADIFFSEDTRVLLNDGLGTEDILIKKGATINILDKPLKINVDWQELISRDLIPPEPFVIEVHQNDKIFEGRYFLIFNTTDKQTGVDHYEILEIRPEDEVGVKPKLGWWQRLIGRELPAPDWLVAKMPYLLKDQSLKSIIKVKAIDKAGNERQVEYIPPVARDAQIDRAEKYEFKKILYIVGGASFLVILLIIIINVVKKRATPKRYDE